MLSYKIKISITAALLCFFFGFVFPHVPGSNFNITGALRSQIQNSSQTQNFGDIVTCQAISFFREDKQTGLNKIINNNSQFCSHISHTCCTTSDFNALKNWWQDDRDVSYKTILNETRLEARKRQEDIIFLYTKAIINIYMHFKDAAKIITKTDAADQICVQAARNFLEFKFDMLNYDGYRQDQKQCMNYMNSMQTTFQCSACDPFAQDYMDLQQGIIRLDPKTCKKVNSKCLNAVKTNINYIYPYLNVVEPLVRCTQEGRQTKQHTYNVQEKFGQKLFHTKILDDLSYDMCPKVLSFGERLNINSQGDAGYVLGIYMNTVDILNQNIDFSQAIVLLDKERRQADRLSQDIKIDIANNKKSSTKLDLDSDRQDSADIGNNESYKNLPDYDEDTTQIREEEDKENLEHYNEGQIEAKNKFKNVANEKRYAIKNHEKKEVVEKTVENSETHRDAKIKDIQLGHDEKKEEAENQQKILLKGGKNGKFIEERILAELDSKFDIQMKENAIISGFVQKNINPSQFIGKEFLDGLEDLTLPPRRTKDMREHMNHNKNKKQSATKDREDGKDEDDVEEDLDTEDMVKENNTKEQKSQDKKSKEKKLKSSFEKKDHPVFEKKHKKVKYKAKKNIGAEKHKKIYMANEKETSEEDDDFDEVDGESRRLLNILKRRRLIVEYSESETDPKDEDKKESEDAKKEEAAQKKNADAKKSEEQKKQEKENEESAEKVEETEGDKRRLTDREEEQNATRENDKRQGKDEKMDNTDPTAKETEKELDSNEEVDDSKNDDRLLKVVKRDGKEGTIEVVNADDHSKTKGEDEQKNAHDEADEDPDNPRLLDGKKMKSNKKGNSGSENSSKKEEKRISKLKKGSKDTEGETREKEDEAEADDEEKNADRTTKDGALNEEDDENEVNENEKNDRILHYHEDKQLQADIMDDSEEFDNGDSLSSYKPEKKRKLTDNSDSNQSEHEDIQEGDDDNLTDNREKSEKQKQEEENEKAAENAIRMLWASNKDKYKLEKKSSEHIGRILKRKGYWNENYQRTKAQKEEEATLPKHKGKRYIVNEDPVPKQSKIQKRNLNIVNGFFSKNYLLSHKVYNKYEKKIQQKLDKEVLAIYKKLNAKDDDVDEDESHLGKTDRTLSKDDKNEDYKKDEEDDNRSDDLDKKKTALHENTNEEEETKEKKEERKAQKKKEEEKDKKKDEKGLDDDSEEDDDNKKDNEKKKDGEDQEDDDDEEDKEQNSIENNQSEDDENSRNNKEVGVRLLGAERRVNKKVGEQTQESVDESADDNDIGTEGKGELSDKDDEDNLGEEEGNKKKADNRVLVKQTLDDGEDAAAESEDDDDSKTDDDMQKKSETEGDKQDAKTKEKQKRDKEDDKAGKDPKEDSLIDQRKQKKKSKKAGAKKDDTNDEKENDETKIDLRMLAKEEIEESLIKKYFSAGRIDGNSRLLKPSNMQKERLLASLNDSDETDFDETKPIVAVSYQELQQLQAMEKSLRVKTKRLLNTLIKFPKQPSIEVKTKIIKVYKDPPGGDIRKMHNGDSWYIRFLFLDQNKFSFHQKLSYGGFNNFKMTDQRLYALNVRKYLKDVKVNLNTNVLKKMEHDDSRSNSTSKNFGGLIWNGSEMARFLVMATGYFFAMVF